VTAEPPPLVVGVFPRLELERRRTLFAALELAYPVRFEGRTEGELGGLEAFLELGGDEQAVGAAAAGLPALALLGAEADGPGREATQELANEQALEPCLRGAGLPDGHLGDALDAGASLGDPDGGTVLATAAPTWVGAGELERALLVPAELGPEEALRERLCLTRSAALLPLAHFLRRLTAALRWQPPAPRASIVFDDPNLHWPSYGFLKLDELAEHARAHGYHAALAMVPLDARFAHPTAVRTLKQSDGAISLVVHGNDHDGGELGRQRTEAEGTALAAQALRRISAFERRTGLGVDRVMVPPHEECSEATVQGLLRCGFEAVTMTRPFPWLAVPPRSWLARPAGAAPLVGWHPASFADAMPVLLRHPLLTRDAPELALRAFLDQPLILYGHHGDLAEGGLEVLASAVEEVNRLRPANWCSLGEIAAANFETRVQGSTLHLRPFARRVRLRVPERVQQLLVELVEAHPGAEGERLFVDGRPRELDEPITVEPGTLVDLQLQVADRVDVSVVATRRPRAAALARRALGEGRDRVLPYVSRGG
jgi:hypothetical protein